MALASPSVPVTLRNEDVVLLRDIYKKTRSDKHFSLPLKRFAESHVRNAVDDRLVDYWIGLESMFLSRGGNQGELKFRAALRIAEFLGKDGADRTRLYELVKQSYDHRSRVVHGVHNASESETLSHIEVETRTILRKALLKLATMTEPFSPDKLDARLLSR